MNSPIQTSANNNNAFDTMTAPMAQVNAITSTAPTAALLKALQSPRAVNATPGQLEYVLAQAMAKAFADMGINTADRHDEITYLVQNMPAEVMRNLPNIRLSEISMAIGKGVLQHYGPFYGLNVATFMRFLMEHYKSEQRAEAVKQHQLAQIPARPNLTAAQLKQQRRNRVLTAFAQYQANGFYHDYGNLVFNSINNAGKIPFSPEQETAILEQARQNLVQRYSRGSLYADERERLKTNLNTILRGDGATLILTEAKQITLNMLFDHLIAQGQSISEFLGIE